MSSAPLHPLFVHFPIALLLVGTLAFLYAEFSASEAWRHTAQAMLLIGWGMGLLAVATGALNFAPIPDNHPAHPTGVIHAVLAFSTEILYALGLWFQRKPASRRVALALFILGALTLAATGYFGGELVYHWKLGISG